jgi:hypothetical protein
MSPVLLVFPPGWSLIAGSPHLALPLLKGYLGQHGISADLLDLNIESANSLVDKINRGDVVRACRSATLESLNEPYFRAEDNLNDHASIFHGSWNIQLGFVYKGFSFESSEDVLSASDYPSPFDTVFNRRIQEISQCQDYSLVGITFASNYQLIPGLRFCKLLRESGFSGKIVIGGNIITRLKTELSGSFIFDLVDFIIVNQGESPLLSLVRKLESEGSDFGSVPQLIWRDSKGSVRENQAEAKFNPNSGSAPDYTGLDLAQYWGTPQLNVVAARGCYWGRCNFCSIPYGWGNSGFAGTRSPRHLVEDIRLLIERHRIRRFKFVDEALTPRFMVEFSRELEAKGIRIEWEGYTRLDACWSDGDFVKTVAAAGFRKGYFGLELVSSRSALNKNDFSPPGTLLDLCGRYGILVHLFFMFGFPGTGSFEAKESFSFIERNAESIDTFDIFPWTYAKHTKVTGASILSDAKKDWALEFRHQPEIENCLGPDEIQNLASHFEELAWDLFPRKLHPTYRMYSPWLHKREGGE